MSRGDISRLVLTGFMGAGKTTVGRLLAPRMGWAFLDLDQHIEATAGAAARILIDTLGEASFRELESGALASALKRSETVVAVGGAAIDLAANQLLLAASPATLVVFLDAPFETLIGRCLIQEQQGGATYRPLLHKTGLARARFSARRSLYAAHAHLTMDAAEHSPGEIALRICDALKQLKAACHLSGGPA
jgi:shikimate kinase